MCKICMIVLSFNPRAGVTQRSVGLKLKNHSNWRDHNWRILRVWNHCESCAERQELGARCEWYRRCGTRHVVATCTSIEINSTQYRALTGACVRTTRTLQVLYRRHGENRCFLQYNSVSPRADVTVTRSKGEAV